VVAPPESRTEDSVPLSEHEQRQFDEIERALYADDPKFANKLRVTNPRAAGKRTFFGAAGIVLLGVAVLISGAVVANWYIGLLGFLIMLVGATRAYAGFRRWMVPVTREVDDPIPLRNRRFGRRPSRGRRSRRSRSRMPTGPAGFVEAMEERWRRRMGRDY
jgi:hypothetical protein